MSKIIYAPIRKKYYDKPKKDNNCPFCNYKRDGKIVVYEGNTAVIVANKYPYTHGHLLVIPKRHIKNIEDLNKDEDKDVMLLIKRAKKFLDKAFHTNGFNIGINQGEQSGGSIDHLHFHIVPRYRGDTGFIDVLTNNRIIATKPEEMVRELKAKNGLR